MQVAIKIIYADIGAVDIKKLAKYVPAEITNMNLLFGHPNIVSCSRMLLILFNAYNKLI